MSKLLNNAESTLFDMADSASNNKDQVRYFDLMRTLKDHKSDIAASYLSSLEPVLRPYPITEAEKIRQKQETEGELSLVDQSMMEDMVLVKSIGERAAGKYREQLSHLEARLEHLALKTEDIFQKHALSPVSFCQAFDDALGETFDAPNKKILFGFYYDEVASKLGSLYDSVNNTLINAGVLPQIKISMQAHKQNSPQARPQPEFELPDDSMADQNAVRNFQPPQSGRHAGGRYGGADAGPAGRQGGGASSSGSGYHADEPGGGSDSGAGTAQAQTVGGGYAMTAAPGQHYHGGTGADGGTGGNSAGESTPAQSLGESQNSTGTARSAPLATTGVSAAGGAPGSAAPYSHTIAGMPAEQVSQTIGSYIGAPLHHEDTAGGENPAFPSSTPQAFGHEEILSALSGVQSLPQFGQPSELRFDANAIKNAVVSEIAKKSGGVVTKRINQIATKTIDFIELIFDAIIDDGDISDTIKALLLRLQIPIIKASMLDPEFFIYDSHPARVLLDSIAEVGFGVSDHEDETYIELDKVVAIILNEYELQTSTFQRALDRLNQYIERQEAIAHEKEEAAQRQVLRDHARNTVLKALRAITAGKSLPESTHPLVLKRWPTLMFNHYLVNGKENDEWVTIIEALREIVNSVQPIITADALAHLKTNRIRLLDKARDFLQQTNQSRYDVEGVLQGLEKTHTSLIARANFDNQEMKAASQRPAETSTETKEPEAITSPESAAPAPRLPRNIMPGMWFHIYMGDDKAARRAKLSVIIVEDSNLVFVNHNGDIIVEKDFEEFTSEIADNRSRMIMGHSVFDHALSSVIGQLHPN